MLKKDEVLQQNSCLNRARDDEMVFVLIGRDSCAAGAIRAWVELRIASGKNKRTDAQIINALACAVHIEFHSRQA